MSTRLLSLLALCLLVASPTAQQPNHPTGSAGLLLIDKLGAHVRFFDPRTFAELRSVQVPANPHDFALSPDHRFAYVPIYGAGVYGNNPNPGHEIYIFDLQKRVVDGVIDTAPHVGPHGIQVGRDGTVYVAADTSRKVLVIDPGRRVIRAALDTDGTGHWIALLPDATKMYVANKTDRLFVTVLDLKTQQIVARIPAPNGTQGIAASPDGSRVIAVDARQPVLLVIDPKTDTVVDRISISGATRGGYKDYFSPDGKYFVTMGPGPQINIFDAGDLKGAQKVVTVGASPMGFAFSPDGSTMLVANHGDGTVSVVDLKAGMVTNTFKGGTGIETLTWY